MHAKEEVELFLLARGDGMTVRDAAAFAGVSGSRVAGASDSRVAGDSEPGPRTRAHRQQRGARDAR